LSRRAPASRRTPAPRVLVLLLALLLPGQAAAQPATEAASDARLHVGPLTFAPRLAIRNVGIDTNVFNDAEAPVRDFTATIGPELDSWLRIGRLHWAGTSTVGWNYFRTASTQRSFDLGQNGRVSLDLGRLVPFARGSVLRARQRPNLEIDARVRREMTEVGGGLELLLGAQTRLTAEHAVRDLRFDDGTAAGESLASALDRRETTNALGGRLVLTPLTTLVVEAEARADRFRHETTRNSDSVRLTGGLELRPLALISGRAIVGARRLRPAAAVMPAFTGAVADVELAYQIRDLTRLTGLVQRDIDYSFELAQAYYVSTGWRFSLVQMVGGGFDIVAHTGRTTLAYRARLDSDPDEAHRRDRVEVYGLGIGRRFVSGVRFGVDLEHVTRRSSVRTRTYEGLRGGGTITYGF